MTVLTDWRDHLARIAAACPWPGPRPLRQSTEGGEYLAVRTERDLPEIVDDVISHRLVIITGESGVGKSSLVSVGLRPALEDAGFAVFELRNWSFPGQRDQQGSLAKQFISASLLEKYQASSVKEHKINLGDPTNFEVLLDSFKVPVVLVLDQFEELIRYDDELFVDMLKWISEVNRKHKFHLVLSLRSEYAHKLREIEAKARPFSVAKYVLEPLHKIADIEAVLKGGSQTREVLIETNASSMIVQWWEDLLANNDAPPSLIGLLHVQALLYELYFLQEEASAKGVKGVKGVKGNTKISQEIVKHYHTQVVNGLSDEDQELPQAIAKALFRKALEQAIDRKLKQCEQSYIAAVKGRPDLPLLAGAKTLIRRTVPHLSSGGYKHVQDKWGLACLIMDSELHGLGLAQHPRIQGLFETMSESVPPPAGAAQGPTLIDLLLAPRADLAKSTLTVAELGLETDQQLPQTGGNAYLEAFGLGPAPWKVDPDDRSAGMMQGQAPLAILVEEFRRYLFAVEWMEQADLIRPTTLPENRTMLSLIHDGFSEALAAWSSASAEAAGPDEAMHQLTASRGEEFNWMPPPGTGTVTPWPAFDGGEKSQLIVNLRWRYCSVRAIFRRVVFVNCDFRGSRFVDCLFEGVTFVNCLLDGASFKNCHLGGKKFEWKPDLGCSSASKNLPSFLVDVDTIQLTALARYQAGEMNHLKGRKLMSVTSGVPARRSVTGETANSTWEPVRAGLAVFGGRLNTLTLQNCTFARGVALHLCLITGSSLDLVEQSTGRIEIRNSFMRGLSVTAPVEVKERKKGDVVHVVSENSVLANVWFGRHLKPDLNFDEKTVVWQLSNLNEYSPKKLTKGLAGNGVVDVVAMLKQPLRPKRERAEDMAKAEAEDMAKAAARIIWDTATIMDFRSSPAESEIDPAS